MGDCNRCGECCSYIKNNKKKYCRYLIWAEKTGKTTCSIYETRLGTVIDEDLDMRCQGSRTEHNRIIPNCPQNIVIAHRNGLI